MFNKRPIRAAIAALAIAVFAAPAAVARPVDGPADWTLPQGFETADTRDAAPARGIYEPVPAEAPKQDLRHADTRDYASGRGTYNAPDVVVVEQPAPAPQPTADGLDWADVGLGAGTLTALSLIALAGGLAVQRRGARQLAG
jgi:hypothetical protein